MASHLNPPNRQSHVCNFSQLIRNIRRASLTQLLCMKVDIYQLPTLPTSLLRTSSPTSGEPLAPSGSLPAKLCHILGCAYYTKSKPSDFVHLASTSGDGKWALSGMQKQMQVSWPVMPASTKPDTAGTESGLILSDNWLVLFK